MELRTDLIRPFMFHYQEFIYSPILKIHKFDGRVLAIIDMQESNFAKTNC